MISAIDYRREFDGRVIMKIAKLREAGDILGREGLALRALQIAKEIVEDGSYKRAIQGAGQLEVLAKACTFDDYWDQKRYIGIHKEEFYMEQVIATQDTINRLAP